VDVGAGTVLDSARQDTVETETSKAKRTMRFMGYDPAFHWLANFKIRGWM
jgi:hypothetical protein